ncbi:MAG: galactitol-1-phosphate 5-dehydrogenase [Nitrososphaerota archaeon]
MRALVLEAPGVFKLKNDVPIPIPKNNEVLLRVKAVGICGSDIPRIMVTGAYHHPLIPGHEFSGEVVSVGKEVKEELIGMRATIYPLIPCNSCRWCKEGLYNLCNNYDYVGSRRDGAFAEYVCVPASNLVHIPENVSFENAALTEPAAVAFHGLKNAGLKEGDKVVIFGAGTIGLILCQIAKLLGAGSILIVDIINQKLEIAQKHGWAETIDASKVNVIKEISSKLPHGADLVIDTSGTSIALHQAITIVRKHGRILLVGNAHDDIKIPQQSFDNILRCELHLIGTWNSIIHEEWKQIIQWMSSGEINVEPIITHRISLDELPKFIQLMYEKKIIYGKVLVII